MIEVFNINPQITLGVIDLIKFNAQKGLTSKREIELAGKLELVKHIAGPNSEIQYDENGKPFLINDSRYISITHSHDKLAIILNTIESTGIDIELIRDKVLRIKHKFLSELELEDAGTDVEKLIIYWSCKEALYKVYGLKEVDFVKNLFVKPFIKHNLGIIIGKVTMPQFNHQFELNYQKLDDYILVYALKKI